MLLTRFSRKLLNLCKNSINNVRREYSGTSCEGLRSTIFALSSGLGKCGVSVIRVSGPGVKKALAEIGGFKALPTPRKAELRKIREPETQEVIDHGLVFWFPKPNSFTGEDCCEFQVHGSTAVVSALLSALGKLEHFRPAEPGEFTKRAFYSGKMDLTKVEGLSALIASETEVQRKHALFQMGGALFTLYSEWANTLLKCLAHIEAYIDFAEDQDIDQDVLENINREVNLLVTHLKSHIEDGRRGERIREGVEMTILGAPNSGKSSLLNVLSRRPAAIVSSMPGTTRDIVQTHLDLNGYPVNLADTADRNLCCPIGLSQVDPSSPWGTFLINDSDVLYISNYAYTEGLKVETKRFYISSQLMAAGPFLQTGASIILYYQKKDKKQKFGLRLKPADNVEAEGISRALQSAQAADLILIVLDVSSLVDWAKRLNIHVINQLDFSSYVETFIVELGIEQQVQNCDNLRKFIKSNAQNIVGNSAQGLIILNKVDLLSSEDFISPEIINNESISIISCKNGSGIENLVTNITRKLERLCGSAGLPSSGFSRPYQRHCLQECLTSLLNFQKSAVTMPQADLSAQYLRQAVSALGKVTGRVSPEQLLDIIFRDFCIGK